MYQLRNQYSNKFLDVDERTTQDGAALVQWGDLGGDSQQWQVVDAGDRYVRLVNRRSGRAADVLDRSMEDGAAVVEWSGHDGANQQWQLVAVGSAAYPERDPVTGDLGVHDPSVVRRPDRGYLLASTRPDIGLKTSPDRVAWTDVGTVFAAGGRGPFPTRPVIASCGRRISPTTIGLLPVLFSVHLRVPELGDLPGHQHDGGSGRLGGPGPGHRVARRG